MENQGSGEAQAAPGSPQEGPDAPKSTPDGLSRWDSAKKLDFHKSHRDSVDPTEFHLVHVNSTKSAWIPADAWESREFPASSVKSINRIPPRPHGASTLKKPL